jgi:hypothetical protein
MANYTFPNVDLSLGANNHFVRDIQRALNIAETGVYDFLTMAAVVVHKFKNGLNHNDPTVGPNTWDSIFGTNSTPEDATRNERTDNGNGTDNRNADGTPGNPDRQPAIPETRAVTTGQVNRDDIRTAEDNVTTQPAGTNPAAPGRGPTATGTTDATDRNQPNTGDDAPRDDQPTTTAEEQQQQGGPVGGTGPRDETAGTELPSESADDARPMGTAPTEGDGGNIARP